MVTAQKVLEVEAMQTTYFRGMKLNLWQTKSI
jgi:hypothetical protein